MLRNATQMLQITAQMSPFLNTQLQQWTLLSPYKFRVNFFLNFLFLLQYRKYTNLKSNFDLIFLYRMLFCHYTNCKYQFWLDFNMLEYVDKCHNNVIKVKCYHNVSKYYTKLHHNVTLPFFVMLTNVSQMLQITCYEMFDKCFKMSLNVMKC